ATNQRRSRQGPHVHPRTDGLTVQQDGHLRGGGYRYQLGSAEAHGTRLGSFGARGKHIYWTALPGGTVKNRLTIRSKARRTDAAASESELSIHRRRQRRLRKQQLACIHTRAQQQSSTKSEKQRYRDVLAPRYGCLVRYTNR